MLLVGSIYKELIFSRISATAMILGSRSNFFQVGIFQSFGLKLTLVNFKSSQLLIKASYFIFK